MTPKVTCHPTGVNSLKALQELGLQTESFRQASNCNSDCHAQPRQTKSAMHSHCNNGCQMATAYQNLASLGSNEQPGCSVDSRAKVVSPPSGGVGADLSHVSREDPHLHSHTHRALVKKRRGNAARFRREESLGVQMLFEEHLS